MPVWQHCRHTMLWHETSVLDTAHNSVKSKTEKHYYELQCPQYYKIININRPIKKNDNFIKVLTTEAQFTRHITYRVTFSCYMLYWGWDHDMQTVHFDIWLLFTESHEFGPKCCTTDITQSWIECPVFDINNQRYWNNFPPE